MLEKWTMMYNFPAYIVSSFGRVKRSQNDSWNRPPKILKTEIRRKYYYVPLCVNKHKRKAVRVHRAVLESFVCPCPKDMECNHKDGNKLNNHLSNLEWVTRSENAKHAVRNGLMNPVKGEEHPISKLKNSDVRSIRNLLTTNITQVEIARMFNVTPSNICHIKKGNLWKHLK